MVVQGQATHQWHARSFSARLLTVAAFLLATLSAYSHSHDLAPQGADDDHAIEFGLGEHHHVHLDNDDHGHDHDHDEHPPTIACVLCHAVTDDGFTQPIDVSLALRAKFFGGLAVVDESPSATEYWGAAFARGPPAVC